MGSVHVKSWRYCLFTFYFGQGTGQEIVSIQLLRVNYLPSLIILYIVNYHMCFEILAKRLRNVTKSKNKNLNVKAGRIGHCYLHKEFNADF